MLQKSLTAKPHLSYVDGLRALMALFVVMHHAQLQINFATAPLTGIMRKAVGIFTFGHYAVDIFIVLSGFCLMLPLIKTNYILEGGARHFFYKRMRRILLPYFLAMGFSLLLIATLIGYKTGTHWDITIPVTAKDILTHLILAQDIFRDTSPKINHAFWSISVEWRIYLLFPLLLACWRKLGPIGTTLATLVSAFGMLSGGSILSHYYPNLNLSTTGICPHYLSLFAIGMLAADLAFSEGSLSAWRSRIPWGPCLLGLTIIVVVLSLSEVKLFGHHIPWQGIDMLVGFWALCLLVALTLSYPVTHIWAFLQNILSWRPLAFVGMFAYSIYLIHAPLLQILWEYVLLPLHLSPLMTFWTLGLLGTPAIIFISYIFFLVCERPFLSQRKSNRTPIA